MQELARWRDFYAKHKARRWGMLYELPVPCPACNRAGASLRMP